VQWSPKGSYGYAIDTDRGRLDLDAVHGFLRTAYWSEGVLRDVVERSIDNSLPFGLYAPGGELAGFARMVTDFATFAWLADVFVLEAHRGRGLGEWLVQTAVEHPELDGVRRFMLGTADAHSLYARMGFETADVARIMERTRPASELYRVAGRQKPV
jgi:GNAT superfamily N-acetyltransferase